MDQTNTICILIGPPGAGKGTISRFCVEELGYKHISTGDLCRKHIEGKTEIGEKIDFFMKSGKLVDDALISSMLIEQLTDFLNNNDSVILDGYPRTVRQAQLLDEYIKKSALLVRVKVICLSVQLATIVKRLGSRFICKNKNCQKVYSSFVGSGCVSRVENICDDCQSELVRRMDDSQEVVRGRLTTYKEQENELLVYFAALGREVSVIDAEQPVEKIFEIVKQDLSAFVP